MNRRKDGAPIRYAGLQARSTTTHYDNIARGIGIAEVIAQALPTPRAPTAKRAVTIRHFSWEEAK